MRLHRGLLTSLLAFTFGAVVLAQSDNRRGHRAIEQAPTEGPSPASFVNEPTDGSAPASDARPATPFTITGTPFGGVIPAGFVAHRTSGGTLLFEGSEGDSQQASIELQVVAKVITPGTIDDLAGMVQAYMAGRDAARVDAPQRATAGRAAARVISGSYQVIASDGAANLRQMTIVLEYPEHFVVFNYYNRTEYFERHLPLVKQIVEGFEYRGP